MNGTERVRNTILGLPTDRQPIYGWVAWNLKDQFAATWGSSEAFEDHYKFDAAHIFGHPCPYDRELVDRLARENDEVTPDLLLEEEFFISELHKIIHNYLLVISISQIPSD